MLRTIRDKFPGIPIMVRLTHPSTHPPTHPPLTSSTSFESQRTRLPNPPTRPPTHPQALTATANDRLLNDAIRLLKMDKPYIHRQSFNRPNLSYDVRPKSKVLTHPPTHPPACMYIYLPTYLPTRPPTHLNNHSTASTSPMTFAPNPRYYPTHPPTQS